MFFKIEFNQLPFQPAKQQVIYVESEYNEKINRFIQTNYEAIRKHYEFWGWEFCYMPYLAKDLTSAGATVYYAPYSEGKAECDFKSDFLLGFMANPQNRSKVPPSLVYYSDAFAEEDACIFRGISLDDERYFESDDFSEVLISIRDDISNNSPYSGIMFRMASRDDIYDYNGQGTIKLPCPYNTTKIINLLYILRI